MALICGPKGNCSCAVYLAPSDQLFDLSKTFPMRDAKINKKAIDLNKYSTVADQEDGIFTELFGDHDETFDDMVNNAQNKDRASRNSLTGPDFTEALGIDEEVSIKKRRAPVPKLDENRCDERELIHFVLLTD